MYNISECCAADVLSILDKGVNKYCKEALQEAASTESTELVDEDFVDTKVDKGVNIESSTDFELDGIDNELSLESIAASDTIEDIEEVDSTTDELKSHEPIEVKDGTLVCESSADTRGTDAPSVPVCETADSDMRSKLQVSNYDSESNISSSDNKCHVMAHTVVASSVDSSITSVKYYSGMSVLDFLKVNKAVRDISILKSYFSSKDIDRARKDGIIFIKHGKVSI